MPRNKSFNKSSKFISHRLSFLIILILVIFLSINVLYADVPWTKFTYFKNFEGLNDNLSSTEIDDNEATDIQNIVFDTGGALKKRFGYRTIPSSPAQQVATGATGITGLAFFKQNDGSRYVVLIANVASKATALKKTYSIGGGLPTGAWDNIDYAGLPSTYTNNQLATFSTAENKLVLTLPATTPVKPFVWTGTGTFTDLTADADCPTVSLNVYHKNTLFLAGNTTNPSRLYFSALGDITNYTVTDFIDVSTNDGSQIRGLISVFDSLYIFKDNSIWRLSGTDRDSFILEKMMDNVGTLSQQSIQVVNGLIYFVTSQNDIAAYDGNYSLKFISQKIRNTIGSLNFSRAPYTIGLGFSTYKYKDLDYYAATSMAGSGTNNRVLLFDTGHNAWTKFVGMNPNSWVVGEDQNGQNIMIFGDYLGYVHYYPSDGYFDGDVATSAIDAFYQTKWFKYSEVALGDKYLRLVKTYALSETTASILTVDARSDYETTGKVYTINLQQSGALWDSAIWDSSLWSGQSLITNRGEINKGKNIFQLKFSNSTVNQGFTIFGWENFVEGSSRI